MIEPDDIPWETGPGLANLAPTTVKRVQARVRGPNPDNVARGRNNRARGQRNETRIARIFEAAGWTVYQQGGPGRRDIHIEREDSENALGLPFLRAYSVECKHHKDADDKRMTDGPAPHQARAALAQSRLHAQPHERPIAVVSFAQHGKRTVDWLCLPDGCIRLQEWLRG